MSTEAVIESAPKPSPFLAKIQEGLTDLKQGQEQARQQRQPAPKQEAPQEKPKETPQTAQEPPKKEEAPNPFSHLTKPKEEAKPEETKPPVEGEDRRPTKEDNLSALRKILEEKDAKLKELESKVGQPPEDYTKLKSDYEEAVKYLERYNLERSPRFREKYDAKIQRAESSIRKALASTEQNVDKVMALIHAPDSKERTANLAEVLEGLDKVTSSKVLSALGDFERTREEREMELSNAKTLLAQEEDQRRAALQEGKQFASKLIETTLSEAADNPQIGTFFAPVEGNEAWNAEIAKIHATAKSFAEQNMPLEETAKITVLGAGYPLLYKAYQHVVTEHQRALEELKQLKSASPRTNAGSAPEAKSSGGSFMERFQEGLGQMRKK